MRLNTTPNLSFLQRIPHLICVFYFRWKSGSKTVAPSTRRCWRPNSSPTSRRPPVARRACRRRTRHPPRTPLPSPTTRTRRPRPAASCPHRPRRRACRTRPSAPRPWARPSPRGTWRRPKPRLWTSRTRICPSTRGTTKRTPLWTNRFSLRIQDLKKMGVLLDWLFSFCVRCSSEPCECYWGWQKFVVDSSVLIFDTIFRCPRLLQEDVSTSKSARKKKKTEKVVLP